MSKVYVEMTEEEYLSWLEFKNGKVETKTTEPSEKDKLLDIQVLSVFDTRTSNALRRGCKAYGFESEPILTIRDLKVILNAIYKDIRIQDIKE